MIRFDKLRIRQLIDGSVEPLTASFHGFLLNKAVHDKRVITMIDYSEVLSSFLTRYNKNVRGMDTFYTGKLKW